MKQRVNKLAVFGIVAPALILATPGLAFAHVVVTPNKALTGAYQTFSASVPNEKDIPVTGLRLVIPDTVGSVTPTVKPGWQIETKKSGDNVTEITWTGGTIPVERRDDFTFSAHLPSKAGELDWKAYQTYQDGSVVSWDQKPVDGQDDDSGDKGPYSITVVSDTPDTTTETKDDSSNVVPYVISIAALALSAFAVVRTAKK